MLRAELLEAVAELLKFGGALGQGGFHLADDFGGRFAEEGFVGEAILLRSMSFVEALDFFPQARDFGGLVDGVAVGDAQIELRRWSGPRRPWRRDGRTKSAGSRAPPGAESGSRFSSDEIADAGVCGREVGGDFAFLVELHFGADVARGGDDFLQQRHVLVGRGISPIGRGSGNARARSTRACGLRQAMPEFFGEEGHDRMQQAQRGIEGRENIAPRRQRDFAVGVGELRLDPLDVPVAEIAPEKVVDVWQASWKRKCLERVVDLCGNGDRREKIQRCASATFARNGVRRLRREFPARPVLRA